MKEILPEFIVYQLLAIVVTLMLHPGADFLPHLPGYLIVSNGIAWSIRTIFRLLSLRHGFRHWRLPWQILVGLPAVAVGCVAGSLLAAIPFWLIYDENLLTNPHFTAGFRNMWPVTLLVTVLMIGYYTLRDRLESEELEQERLKGLRARAELAALQSKLNPHFLFNTLNSMLNLVRREPDKVEEMILGLSEIYRKVLQLPERERIALHEEFALAGQYLAIEEVRLGERLRYEIHLPDRLRERRVPPLVIQPLVENAVLHGLAPKPQGGRLRLAAEQGEGTIRIVVEDDGVGFGAAAGRPGGGAHRERGGFGLASARERLRILHGEPGMLRFETPPGGGTRVTLTLPDDEKEVP